MKKEGWRSTVCWPTLREQAGAASTIVSPSLRATRGPPRRFSFPPISFPFTDEPEKDPVTGATGGLLDQAVADKVVPKIFFSNTSYEYWGRVAALIHISADGKQDASISDNVRIYHFTGLQHFSVPFPPQKGTGDGLGQEPQSPLPIRYFWRAMIANMDAWVRSDTLPPASSYPKIADGNLVPLEKYASARDPWAEPAARGEPGLSSRFRAQLAAGNSEHPAA